MNRTIITVLILITIYAKEGFAMLEKENSPYGVTANSLKNIDLSAYQIPQAKGDKIATLNKTGFMKTELDPFSEEFLKYTKNISMPVLEIGAAYGAVTVPALKNNTKVIANDIDEKHLIAILGRVPQEQIDNLYLKLGYFPAQIDFPENSLGAVLMCRVAHFLNGDEFEEGLKKVLKWLAPNGRLYFVSMSPYHHLLKDKFLPIYLERQKNNVQWPGIINNMKDYNSVESEDIPNFLHVFEEKKIKEVLCKLGYEVNKIEKFDYSNNSSDNKGYLGFIATKPSK